MDEKDKKTKKKGKKIFAVIIFLALAITIVGVSLYYLGYIPIKEKEPPKEVVITKSEIVDIIRVEELATLKYKFNSIATKYDEQKSEDDEDNWEYKVAYKGEVKLGTDLKQISDDDIEFDSENKKITITIPRAKILSMDVTSKPTEYIYRKNKYRDETVFDEAFGLCKEDLQKKVKKKSELLAKANENNKSVIKCLVEAVSNIDGEKYQVVVEVAE